MSDTTGNYTQQQRVSIKKSTLLEQELERFYVIVHHMERQDRNSRIEDIEYLSPTFSAARDYILLLEEKVKVLEADLKHKFLHSYVSEP